MQGKGQLLLKAKTMIIQNIQNRTIFTRSDLHRFLSLSPDVEQSTDYLITMQTLTETRYTDWIEEPDRGKFVPKVPATINSVWDITSAPPSGFVSDRQIYPIEGSEKRFTCPNCSGVGEISRFCHSCNGSGRAICPRCAGTGSEVCSSCNGTGTRRDFGSRLEKCLFCDGTGKMSVVCASCNGTGTRRDFGNRLERCFSCDGTGKRIEPCRNCSGTGAKHDFGTRVEKCSFCNGTGKRVCSSCSGHGGRVCYRCNGTGKVIETCRKCAGVGRLIRYQAIICDFKPHEFKETISQWNLPLKELKSAEASQVWEMPVDVNSPLRLQGHPVEVQNAANSLVQQVAGLQSGETRLVRSVLNIKAVPVAHISFRLHGVHGDAWLLGKDFQRLYLPKVPLTFETWVQLKDWFSVGLTFGCFLCFSLFALIILSLIQSPYAATAAHIFGLILTGSGWVICGIILLARRLIAGLTVFAITIASLAYLVYFAQRVKFP